MSPFSLSGTLPRLVRHHARQLSRAELGFFHGSLGQQLPSELDTCRLGGQKARRQAAVEGEGGNMPTVAFIGSSVQLTTNRTLQRRADGVLLTC